MLSGSFDTHERQVHVERITSSLRLVFEAWRNLSVKNMYYVIFDWL